MANHHARLENSERLRKVKAILEDGMPHTSLEIAQKAQTVAPGSCVSELRTAGIDILCRYKGKSESGSKVYEYRMIPKKGQIGLGI